MAPMGMIKAILCLSVMIFCKSPFLTITVTEMMKGINSKSA